MKFKTQINTAKFVEKLHKHLSAEIASDIIASMESDLPLFLAALYEVEQTTDELDARHQWHRKVRHLLIETNKNDQN